MEIGELMQSVTSSAFMDGVKLSRVQSDGFTTDGVACGWSAYELKDGRWAWHAYGPRGGEGGNASSLAEAEDRGRAAEQRLKKPRG